MLPAPASEIISKIEKFLTPERREKIDRVVASRIFDREILLENIYDRGNVSAVMRTAEALGFFKFQICNVSDAFKVSSRVTQGADRWLQITEWDNLEACVQKLKTSNYKIAVTSLDAKLNIEDLPLEQPLVLAFGNERDGVSRDLVELSDYEFKIPMYGFTQSFNISVAAALCLQKLRDFDPRRSEVSQNDLQSLKALYYFRSYDYSERLFGPLTA